MVKYDLTGQENMEKIKRVLKKDIFEKDCNEDGRFAILLSLVPLLVLTFFMNVTAL